MKLNFWDEISQNSIIITLKNKIEKLISNSKQLLIIPSAILVAAGLTTLPIKQINNDNFNNSNYIISQKIKVGDLTNLNSFETSLIDNTLSKEYASVIHKIENLKNDNGQNYLIKLLEEKQTQLENDFKNKEIEKLLKKDKNYVENTSKINILVQLNKLSQQYKNFENFDKNSQNKIVSLVLKETFNQIKITSYNFIEFTQKYSNFVKDNFNNKIRQENLNNLLVSFDENKIVQNAENKVNLELNKIKGYLTLKGSKISLSDINNLNKNIDSSINTFFSDPKIAQFAFINLIKNYDNFKNSKTFENLKNINELKKNYLKTNENLEINENLENKIDIEIIFNDTSNFKADFNKEDIKKILKNLQLQEMIFTSYLDSNTNKILYSLETKTPGLKMQSYNEELKNIINQINNENSHTEKLTVSKDNSFKIKNF